MGTAIKKTYHGDLIMYDWTWEPESGEDDYSADSEP